jgi:serine/threonine-protein kinase RsbW
MTSTPELVACRLEIHVDAGDIRRASEWLSGQCLPRGVPEAQIQRLDLCLNEVLANLIDHAGPGALEAWVELELLMSSPQQGQVALVVSDGGESFDPLAFTPKAVPRSLAEAEPGGLGLMMVRSFSDELNYRRADGRNELKMIVRWPAPP